MNYFTDANTIERLAASYRLVAAQSDASRRLEVAGVERRRRQTPTDHYDALRAKREKGFRLPAEKLNPC